MLFERIVSRGLAHFSYLFGDKNEAIVIDPRRDCEIYVKEALAGLRIAHILETHRNEDYVVGSTRLAHLTGASIWHADSQWDFRYGTPAQPGQRWRAGRLEVEAIATPGHTPGSMSYLLRDPAGLPWMVFCGDALFAGDVGRTDLMGRDRAAEMAGMLYETIFGKLLSLGDGVLVCPAHGAGSVCGESIAERVWTTIGMERTNNPRLQFKRKDEFVAALTGTRLERPPYFSRMETVNLQGDTILDHLPAARPLAPMDFAGAARDAQVLDTRMELGFGAAHVPGALSIWPDGLASFAGWFLSYDRPILLVTDDGSLEETSRVLARLGFDNIAGSLAGGMLNWHMSGMQSESTGMITVQDLCSKLDQEEKLWILDVRSDEELQRDGQIPGAQHIHVTRIEERKEEIPRNRNIHVFCGSGMRSMITASILQRSGWKDLTVILGGMAGWRSKRYPIKRE